MPAGTPERRFALHPAAARDLDGIWAYIAEDNIDAADRVLAELLAACEALAVSPGIGHSRAGFSGRLLRFWIVRQYLIAYAPERRPVEIVGVVHGRRDPRALGRILRGRI